MVIKPIFATNLECMSAAGMSLEMEFPVMSVEYFIS